MFSMTLDQHFATLRAFSEKVDDYISTELYKYDFDEDETYTAKDVLGGCYNFILTDLKEIGVYVDMGENDLLQDIFTCGYLYLVAKFLREDNFKSLLKSTNITAKVISFVDEVGNDNNAFGALVDLVLEATQTKNLEITELPYISGMIYNDDKFPTYLKQVLKAMDEEDELTIPEYDIGAVTAYLTRINISRQRVRNLALDVANSLPDMGIDLAKLNKLIRDYDYDKITPDVVSIYARIDNGEEPANENLAKFKREQLDAHHLRSPHHIEYWLQGIDHNFTTDNLIMLVCHHAEPGVDATQFINKVKEMLAKGGEFFDESRRKLAIAIAKHVATYIEREKE